MRAPRVVESVFGLAAALGFAAVAVLSGCAPHASSPEGHGSDSAAVSIAVFTAGAAAEAPGLVVPGRVKASEEVTLTARLAARVTALPVREGEHFGAGQPLALFDAPETRSAIRAARSGLDAATLRLAFARRQQARMESLFSSGVVARRDLELAQAEARTADAESASARATAEQWTSGTSIPAPFAGVVVRRRVDPGTSVSPGAPLLDLRSDAVSEIEAPIPESAVDAARVAQAAFQMDEGPWLGARLVRLDGMTDFATRTRMAHLTPLAGTLEPGRFVRVRFNDSGTGRSTGLTTRSGIASSRVPSPNTSAAPREPHPLAVPLSALTRRGALTGVFVIADDRAELRWLRLGRTVGAQAEVLAGLWPGESVAVSPEGLFDGRRVRTRR